MVSEAVANELKRYFPLDVFAHGTTTAEIAQVCTRGNATLVFESVTRHNLEQLGWVIRTLEAPRVVVFGLSDALDDLRCCARHQVGALVCRDASVSDLALAVEAVAGGKHYTSAALIPGLMELAAGTRTFANADLSRLTDRERQVAPMLSRGLTYAQIAVDLAVSPATVKNHAHNIYRKMRDVTRSDRVARWPKDAIGRREWSAEPADRDVAERLPQRR